MTRIFFVRHGHPSPEVSAVQPDPPLSADGRRQALAAAHALAATVEHPRVLSSPALRAHQTARVIGARLTTAVGLEPDLAEIRGARAADTAARDRISQRWRSGDRDAGQPGGETLGQALDRFEQMLQRVVAAGPDDLVLVSHGAFIAMGLLHLCDHDLDPHRVARLSHCATVELQIYRPTAPTLGRVRGWNSDPPAQYHPDIRAQRGLAPGGEPNDI